MSRSWYEDVEGILLDATGVLYNSNTTGGVEIPGSVEAIEKLKASGIPFKVCSNQSTQPRSGFVNKLRRYGFNLQESDIVCPGPLIAAQLLKKGLRPHLLVHPEARKEYTMLEQTNPNCVVVGDAQEHISYQALNEAFRVLHSMPVKRLYTYGGGKYYRRSGELVMDSGAYAKMLQHACECEMIVCGKPEASFFTQALELLDLSPSQCVMIGDDIVSDVAGAQAIGMRGIQVRTGKYRPEDENHPTITADAYVSNLLAAIDKILLTRQRHDSGIELIDTDV